MFMPFSHKKIFCKYTHFNLCNSDGFLIKKQDKPSPLMLWDFPICLYYTKRKRSSLFMKTKFS